MPPQLRSAKKPDADADPFEKKYTHLALDFIALFQDSYCHAKGHMLTFFVEFNNSKEAFDHRTLKDRINDKYEEIRTSAPSYIDMKFEADDEGQYKYILPPGEDWKTLYKSLEYEHMLYGELVLKFFSLLEEFLRGLPDAEYHSRDIENIHHSYILAHDQLKRTEFHRSEWNRI